MFCETTSRPQSPFLNPSPHIHLPQSHNHLHQSYNTPQQSNTRQFFTSPTTSNNFNSSQSTPIPNLPCIQQIGQSISMPSTPYASSSSSTRPNIQHRITSIGGGGGQSSKHNKKLIGSTNQKQKNVQMSLELKVEKAKGFHSFFVPLCKNLPPAPPCSPVNGQNHLQPKKQQQQQQQHQQQNDNLPINPNLNMMEIDYFGSWNKSKIHDTWVEDITNTFNQPPEKNWDNGIEEGMEVDFHR
ncbi:uncharacterized protein I206_104671 [Kwoniella pini CBS 10737]|uniref:Uncharacterized protein n=1 Tax=Kwoniella pini CBS 10737 TaxID=1296096 RepID=A0AAJ8L7U6_9TREE